MFHFCTSGDPDPQVGKRSTAHCRVVAIITIALARIYLSCKTDAEMLPWQCSEPLGGALVDSKMLTVRVPADQAEELEQVADVDGVPVAEEVRAAIAAHIEARRKDRAFRERLRASIERNKEILEKLAET